MMKLSALVDILYLACLKKGDILILSSFGQILVILGNGSSRRFYTLHLALAFDDIRDRNIRKAIDNLAPIRRQFYTFVECGKLNYQIVEYGTVEMLETFRRH